MAKSIAPKENIWQCVAQHRTEYHNPIQLSKGEIVTLGEFAPEEQWKNWIWAENSMNEGGWIPIQLVERLEEGSKGVVAEDYSAKELNIDEGELVLKLRSINGWSWVKIIKNNSEGWIPDEKIILYHGK